MPRTIPSDEMDLLQKLDLLGQRGFNQSEAAEELKLPLPTLRSKVEKHGLEMVNAVQVRAKLGGKRLADLVRDGEIVCAKEPAGVA